MAAASPARVYLTRKGLVILNDAFFVPATFPRQKSVTIPGLTPSLKTSTRQLEYVIMRDRPGTDPLMEKNLEGRRPLRSFGNHASIFASALTTSLRTQSFGCLVSRSRCVRACSAFSFPSAITAGPTTSSSSNKLMSTSTACRFSIFPNARTSISRALPLRLSRDSPTRSSKISSLASTSNALATAHFRPRFSVSGAARNSASNTSSATPIAEGTDKALTMNSFTRRFSNLGSHFTSIGAAPLQVLTCVSKFSESTTYPAEASSSSKGAAASLNSALAALL